MYRGIILFILPFFFASFAHAQLTPGLASFERLTIDSSTAFPGAGEVVFLTVRAVSLDLDHADIRWYENGKPIASGPAQQGAVVVLGDLGSRTDISVVVTTEDGSEISAVRTLRPAEVDLLWESDAYVPPFYKGKRQAASGAAIRVEALPRLKRADGTFIAAKDIVFTWRRNDGIVSSASGRGKTSVQLPAPQFLGEDSISVEAASVDSTLIAASSVTIRAFDPFVILYQDHPLFGVQYHTALSPTETFSDIEATFAAVPYFAAVNNSNDLHLNYDWRVNGTPIEIDAENPSQLTINAENSDGSARIELALTHKTDYIMNARGIWNFMFNSGLGTAGINLFGGSE